MVPPVHVTSTDGGEVTMIKAGFRYLQKAFNKYKGTYIRLELQTAWEYLVPGVTHA